MKKRFSVLIISLIFSSCGSYLTIEQPKPNINERMLSIKNYIIKKLSFLPYIEYVPDIEPSTSGATLLNEIYKYENIVNKHIEFDQNKKNDLFPSEKGTLKKILNGFMRFFKKDKDNDTIEEKISEINALRQLTAQYEAWPNGWEKSTNQYGKDLSLDEVDLLKVEIKRISKNLKKKKQTKKYTHTVK